MSGNQEENWGNKMWVSHFPHLPHHFSLYMGWEAGSSHGAKDFISRRTLSRRECQLHFCHEVPAQARPRSHSSRGGQDSLLYGPGKVPFLPSHYLLPWEKLHEAQEGSWLTAVTQLQAEEVPRQTRQTWPCQTLILVPKTRAV